MRRCRRLARSLPGESPETPAAPGSERSVHAQKAVYSRLNGRYCMRRTQARRARDGVTAQRGRHAGGDDGPGGPPAYTTPTATPEPLPSASVRTSGTPRRRTSPIATRRHEKRLRQGGTGASASSARASRRVGAPQTDRIFVFLAEFGDTQHSAYSGPAPDNSSAWARCTTRSRSRRLVDDSTLWQADYDHAHYQNMFFSPDEEVLTRASPGMPSYSIDGDVTEWVKSRSTRPSTVATTAATSSARARTS